MGEHTVRAGSASIVCWETLDQFARTHIQAFIQRLLEEEVTDLLGREKSQRRSAGPEEEAAPPLYRNGFGKPRQLTTAAGTVTVRRPRLRGLAERFESQVLPLFARRTPAVAQVLPELYLHGLALGDFDLALRGLLGEEAALSPNTLLRLKAGWQQEYDAWCERELSDLAVVYLWVDGLYVKAGLEKDKAALLVAVAVKADGSKVVLAVQAGYRESTESWSGLLRDLKRRGLRAPRLVIGDGNLGIWGALMNIYPEADEQRCWNHRILNVMDRVPKAVQPQARVWLRDLMYAPTREKAVEQRSKFAAWCEKKGCPAAAQVLGEDWERLVRYYDYPAVHWVHLRTTNPVESPFAAARLRTDAAKRFQKVTHATAVLWKLLRVAETRFRKVNAPELLVEVAAGVRFVNGRRASKAEVEKVAA
jgi:putative transposase